MPECDTKFYITELQSEECFCGKKKNAGNSFCCGCYKSLPRDMQKGLYLRMFQGYEENYDDAVAWLM